MSYQALARKWRPRHFDQIVGQETVLQALVNALDRQRLHHAYLFTGTRGVGKTTLARVFARALNCERGLSSHPCGECNSCKEIDTGRFIDLIEVDAASRTKVEDTRELLENVQYAPSRGRYKVYLIDEVHMLSTHSFNALLKTLEEPPPHVKFLLATTDPQKLPKTILSRCLQFNLRRLSEDKILDYLQYILHEENLSGDKQALMHITNAADGSLRDALSFLDQAIVYGSGEIKEVDVRLMLGIIDQRHIMGLLECLAARNVIGLLKHTNEIADFAPDYDGVLESLLSWLHHIALVQAVPSSINNIEDGPDLIRRLAALISPEDVQLYYQIGLIGRRDLGIAPSERAGFEMILLRMLAFQPVSSHMWEKVPPPSATPLSSIQAESLPLRESITPSGHHFSSDIGNGIRGGGNKEKWTQLLECLPLQGMAKALAVNCILREHQDDSFYLTLAPAHASLHNPRLEERIREALSIYLKRPVKLMLSIESHQGETPQGYKDRMAQDRQRAAEEAIASDNNIKILQEVFEARIVPNSVRPLDA